MKTGGTGGSHTAKVGMTFEQITDDALIDELSRIGFFEKEIIKLNKNSSTVHGRILQSESDNEIEIFYKSGIYKLFFEPRGINYRDSFSARLEPDTAIFSSRTNTLTVIEKKQMVAAGSVAEKLQTCDYKRMYYETLLSPLGISLEISWILGPYFKQKEIQLKSVYDYMLSKRSKYYFGDIPVEELNI